MARSRLRMREDGTPHARGTLVRRPQQKRAPSRRGRVPGRLVSTVELGPFTDKARSCSSAQRCRVSEPWATGTAQLARIVYDLGAAGCEALATRSAPAAPDAVKDLLRSPVRRVPSVWPVDDVDTAGTEWWELIAMLASEGARQPRPWIIATGTLAPGEEHPAALLPAALRPFAEVLEPLAHCSFETMREWIGPATREITDELYALTSGNPRWLMRIWGDWRKRGVVAQQGGTWQAPAGINTDAGLLNDILAWYLRGQPRKALLHEALGWAALEGRRFLADVTAAALGVDRDHLIDAFDDIAQGAGVECGLLREVGFTPLVGGAASGFRYEFPSFSLWRAARDSVPPKEEAHRAELLALHLRRLMGSRSYGVATTLADLYAMAAQPYAALTFRTMASTYAASYEGAEATATCDRDEQGALEAHAAAAYALHDVGDTRAALFSLQALLPRMLQTLPAGHPSVLQARTAMAWLHAEMGNVERGMAEADHILADLLALPEPNRRLEVMVRQNMAECQALIGESKRARRALTKILDEQMHDVNAGRKEVTGPRLLVHPL